jgi:hypothetical protein
VDNNHKTVTVAPNGRGIVDFRLLVAQRPLLFRRTYPFQIQVSAPYTDPETHEGQLVARPRVPGWFLITMLLLLGTFCWGFLTLLNTLLSLL